MAESAHPETKIGHVHLKVSDLQRARWFYCDVLGFTEMARYGSEALFVSAGGYHHHIGLNTWHSKGMPPAPVNHPGLYHFAILYPSRKELAKAVKRVLENGVMLDGASDHGVSEAIYLHDPDGNGIELYCDRDKDEWPMRDGKLDMITAPLDIESLLAEA